MQKERKAKEKGGCRMAVSKAIVPLLKDDVAKSFMKTMKTSKLRPYTDQQSRATDQKITEILKKRTKK